MSMRIWLWSSLALALVACGDGGPVSVTASLGESEGDLESADEAWYSSAPFSLTFEQVRGGEASPLLRHHLDLWTSHDNDRLLLTAGTTYEGGPAVHGEDYSHTTREEPWLILVSCRGTSLREECMTMQTIEVDVVSVDSQGVARIDYRGYLAGETEPSAVGTFFAPSDPEGVIFATPTESEL
jgi:hypothetical protein